MEPAIHSSVQNRYPALVQQVIVAFGHPHRRRFVKHDSLRRSSPRSANINSSVKKQFCYDNNQPEQRTPAASLRAAQPPPSLQPMPSRLLERRRRRRALQWRFLSPSPFSESPLAPKCSYSSRRQALAPPSPSSPGWRARRVAAVFSFNCKSR